MGIHKTDVCVEIKLNTKIIYANLTYTWNGEDSEYKMKHADCDQPKIGTDILKAIDKMFKMIPEDLIHKNSEVVDEV